MSSQEGPRGVEVLQIDSVKVIQHYEGEDLDLASGALQVLLVTLDVEDPTRSPKLRSEKLGEDYSTDLWIVLNVGEFSLPIKASQRIEPKRSSSSYILPSLEIQDLSIELFIPSTTSKDEVSEFEDLLSDYCAFVSDDKSHSGQIEIMDENGQVIGTVISPFPNARIEEDPNLNVRGHEKDPVLLELPPQEMESGQKAEIADQRLRVKRAPMQSFPQAGGSKSDWIVSGAQYVSSGLIKGSTLISKGLNNAADSYTARTKPAEQPLVSSPDQSDFPSSNRSLSINPAQQPSQAQGSSALGSLNRYSGSAVKLSKETTSVVLNAAAGVGGRVGRAAGIQPKVNADGSEGPPPTGIRGIVNRSLIAASVVLDGIDQGAQNLLEGGSEASSKVIGHKYGESARVTAGHSAGTARNLFLIYKDVSGIRRKCLLKMAGGTFKARLNNGEEVEMSVNELPQQQLQHQGQLIEGSASTTNTPPDYSRSSSFGGNGNSIAPPPPHPKSGASTPNKEKW